MTDVTFVDEPIAVEARFDEDGAVRPRAFVWKGRTYQITDVGRQRTESKDYHQLRYYLVMTPARETFELCLDTETLRWRITRIWKRPAAV